MFGSVKLFTLLGVLMRNTKILCELNLGLIKRYLARNNHMVLGKVNCVCEVRDAFVVRGNFKSSCNSSFISSLLRKQCSLDSLLDCIRYQWNHKLCSLFYNWLILLNMLLVKFKQKLEIVYPCFLVFHCMNIFMYPMVGGH